MNEGMVARGQSLGRYSEYPLPFTEIPQACSYGGERGSENAESLSLTPDLSAIQTASLRNAEDWVWTWWTHNPGYGVVTHNPSIGRLRPVQGILRLHTPLTTQGMTYHRRSCRLMRIPSDY